MLKREPHGFLTENGLFCPIFDTKLSGFSARIIFLGQKRVICCAPWEGVKINNPAIINQTIKGTPFMRNLISCTRFQNFFFKAFRTTKWLSDVYFRNSFIVLLFQNIRLWIQWHTYEILEKNHGKPPWPNLAGWNLPFPVRDPWGRRFEIFSNQNFSGYILTKFRT